MNVPEASRFTGIGRTKLYELMDKGHLPYAKIGASRRIPKVALVKLLAASLKGPV
jgi:excisionase family DNA binding protein